MKNRFALLLLALTVLLAPLTAAAAADEVGQTMVVSQLAPIITDDIERNPQTGDIMIELDVDALPNGTASLQLRSGDMILLDGLTGVVLLEMSPDELSSNGELSLTALDEDGTVLAEYTLQIADHLPAAPMDTMSIVLLIMAVLAVIGAVAAVVVIKKKKP